MERLASGPHFSARRFLALLIASGMLLVTTAGSAAGGPPLLWSDRFGTADSTEIVNAVDAKANRVFAAGGSRGVDGQNHFLVRAYQATTGSLLWQDESSANGFATVVAAKHDMVFVAGGSTLRAHDAATGVLLWENQARAAGGFAVVNGIAVRGPFVFLAGAIQKQGGNFDFDFWVRVHDANTGALLWEDVVDKANGDDVATTIAVTGRRVVVAGWSSSAGPLPPPDEEPGLETGNTDLLVRVYDAFDGKILWEDVFDRAGGDDVATTVVASGRRVFVGGISEKFDESGTSNLDGVVRAYDAATGAVLWHVDVDSGPTDLIASIVVRGRRLFVAGRTQNTAGNADVLVQAYDTETGAALWSNIFDGGNGDDWANAIAVTRGKVAIAGRVTDANGNIEFLVRTYKSVTGDLLWEDRFDVGRIDEARDITIERGRIVAVGLGEDDGENFDFIVRGYSAHQFAGRQVEVAPGQ